jgi:hypothetical protein
MATGEKDGLDTRLAADSRSGTLPLEGGKRRNGTIAFECKNVVSWVDGKAQTLYKA